MLNPDRYGTYSSTSTGNTPAAQWVEFLIQEDTENLSLAVGTSGNATDGYRVLLHFGESHASDLSYGDSDYGTWGLSAPTWTFTETDTGTFTNPTLRESSRYPGLFRVACASTNGSPTAGFSVSATVTRGTPAVPYNKAADHDAPGPAHTRICKP